MYRFKLKTPNRILFCSSWLDVNDLLDAIALKDEYLQTHPEYNHCSVKWETK